MIIVGIAGQKRRHEGPNLRPSSACQKFDSKIGSAITESVVAGCMTPLSAGTAIRGIPTPSTPFDVPAARNANATIIKLNSVGSNGSMASKGTWRSEPCATWKWLGHGILRNPAFDET